MNKKSTIIIIFMVLLPMVLSASSVPCLKKSIITNQSMCNLESTSVSYFDDDSWSMFRHDPEHSGCSPSSAPETDTVLWSFIPKPYNWLAESSPAIVDNKVYIGGCCSIGPVPIYGRVYCLDEFTGAEIWNHQTDGWVLSSPAVYENKVYVSSFFFNKIHCLNADDGSQIWEYTNSYPVFSSAVVVNDRVYVGSANFTNEDNGEVVCLDSTDGSLIWSFSPNGGVYSSPAVYNNKVFFGSLDKKLYCLNAETGVINWSFNTGGWVRSSPTTFDNKVYVGSGNGKVFCVNASNGDEIWNYPTNDSIASSPAIANGKIFFGSYDTKFYCLNALTGVFLWDYAAGDKIMSSPAAADYKIYICSDDGIVHCLNDSTGVKIWNYSTEHQIRSSPAIANSKLFVSCAKKYIDSDEISLFCFCDELPPAQPSRPSGPLTGEVGVTYEYSTVTTDPEGDMVRYGWDWNGDKEVDEWTSFYQSGETIAVSHTWQQMGVRLIRVRAEDTVGMRSTWSKPLVVVTPEQTVSISVNVQNRVMNVLNNILNR